MNDRPASMSVLPHDPGRVPLHHRRIDVRGWRRTDGLFEVEATLTDTKARPTAWTRDDGVLHDMRIVVRFDEALLVHEVSASSDVTPYPVCREAAAGLASLRGLSMAAGWRRVVRDRLGGVQGCTHLVELLGPLATTAFQTTSEVRMAAPVQSDGNGRPAKIDTCLAYSRSGELVRERWPEHYEPASTLRGER